MNKTQEGQSESQASQLELSGNRMRKAVAVAVSEVDIQAQGPATCGIRLPARFWCHRCQGQVFLSSNQNVSCKYFIAQCIHPPDTLSQAPVARARAKAEAEAGVLCTFCGLYTKRAYVHIQEYIYPTRNHLYKRVLSWPPRLPEADERI